MKPFIAGLVLLLISTHPLPAAAKIKAAWSKVEAVPSGTRTTVLLYKDRAPAGKRKIEGVFRSATAQAIMLLLPDGKRRTLQKQNVRKVLIYRPFKKRYQGWLTIGIALGVVNGMLGYSADVEGVSASGVLMSNAAFVPAAGGIAFLAAPKMGGIYNVPIERRDATPQTPSQQGSSPTVPPLVGKPSSDWLHQARQALMRKDVPLHLSGSIRSP